MEKVINKIAELTKGVKNIQKGIKTCIVTTEYPKCSHWHLEEDFYIPLANICRDNDIIWDIDVDVQKEEYSIFLKKAK